MFEDHYMTYKFGSDNYS